MVGVWVWGYFKWIRMVVGRIELVSCVFFFNICVIGKSRGDLEIEE